MEDGGVWGKNQDLGLSLGSKIRAHLGCFQWQWLLLWLVIRMARKGAAAFLYWGKGGAVGFGSGDTQERIRKGWRTCLYGLLPSPTAGLAQLEAALARRQVGLIGRENGQQKRKEKEMTAKEKVREIKFCKF
jgi:hypothetical protein